MVGNCFGRLVILGWVLFASLIAFQTVEGGTMEQLCLYTSKNFFELCMECLKKQALPQIKADDQDKQWAGKIVECARYTSHICHLFMADYSRNSTGIVAEVAKVCAARLNYAQQDYIWALDYWKSENTSKVLEFINYGRSEVSICEGMVPGEMSPVVHHALTCLRIRGTMATDIITAVSTQLAI